MGLLIDTSVFVATERSGGVAAEAGPGFVVHFDPSASFGISVLTLVEMAFGYERHQRHSHEQKAMLMAALRAAYNVFPLNAVIAERAGRLNATLYQNGTPIGLAYVLIAATALELGFAVLTHNTRHFRYVPGLRVHDAADL